MHGRGLKTRAASWVAMGALVALTALAGCTTTDAVSEPATKAPEDSYEIPPGHERGAALYRKHCIECHELYHPADFTDFEWSSVMPDMKREANIDDATSKTIEAFLRAANE